MTDSAAGAHSGLLAMQTVVADPYPFYEMFRSPAPLYAAPLGLWIVTTFDSAAAILRDRRFLAFSPRLWEADATDSESHTFRRLERTLHRQLMYLEQADHSRLRGVVNEYFAARAVAELRPSVERLVHARLDAVTLNEPCDAVALFSRLPVEVAKDLLGLEIDTEVLYDICCRIARGIDLIVDHETAERANDAFSELDEIVRGALAANANRTSIDGLLGSLAVGGASEQEVSSLCGQLLGSHETTSSLILNTLMALDENELQRDKLAAAPKLVGNAIEESLRFSSPVQMTSRRATERVTIADVCFNADDEVGVIIAAANRDPTVFEAPATFDIERPNPKHLTFGYGPHFCLGAALARLEAEVAISAVYERFPAWQVVPDTVEWRPSITVRGPARLIVRFG